jgi:CRP-like cAMP-binding protein
MDTIIPEFISRYIILSDAEMKQVLAEFKSKSIRKGDFLLEPGQVCKDIVIVKSGCLRLYYLTDEEDIEVSVWFAFKESSAIEMYSFISENPSQYFIQAIEDSEVYFLSKDRLKELYKTIPRTQEMMKNFWEDVILNLIQRFTSLQKNTAEERYLDLLNKPGYLETIPQKYLASFIGITPTSLSRIRRKIR